MALTYANFLASEVSPQLGEVGLFNFRQFIWIDCLDCGKERWVAFINNEPVSQRCHLCAVRTDEHRNRASECQRGKVLTKEHRRRISERQSGERNAKWKGGRTKTNKGYIRIWLSSDDFFYPMADKHHYVLEHRLVVAKALGRCLHLWEIVHHKRGFAKDDNHYPKTLQLVTDDRHKQITLLETRIKQLEKRVTLLEAENILLRQNERTMC